MVDRLQSEVEIWIRLITEVFACGVAKYKSDKLVLLVRVGGDSGHEIFVDKKSSSIVFWGQLLNQFHEDEG